MYANSYEKPLIFGHYVISLDTMKVSFAFQENDTYNLRSSNDLTRKKIRKTQYGIAIGNFGAKIWDLLPIETESSSFLSVFKNKVRK